MSALRLSGTPGGAGTFLVPSRTRPDAVYRVVVSDEGVWCPCRGFGFRWDCWHAGAALATVATERATAVERRELARVALERIADEFACE